MRASASGPPAAPSAGRDARAYPGLALALRAAALRATFLALRAGVEPLRSAPWRQQDVGGWPLRGRRIGWGARAYSGFALALRAAALRATFLALRAGVEPLRSAPWRQQDMGGWPLRGRRIGWGARGRTWNLRSQSPSLCQLSYAPRIGAEGPGGPGPCAKRVSASSTVDACAPCADRPSCARRRARRGSGSLPDATGNAFPRHARPVRAQCHGGSRRPGLWCHRR